MDPKKQEKATQFHWWQSEVSQEEKYNDGSTEEQQHCNKQDKAWKMLTHAVSLASIALLFTNLQ